jgi:hypothetical protein
VGDLRLNEQTYDLDLVNGDLVLTQSDDAIRQLIVQRLRTFLGEWFLDLSVGVPYFQDILKKNPNIQVVDGVLKQTILDTPGVVELLTFELDFESGTRKLKVDCSIRTRTGVIDFSEAFG